MDEFGKMYILRFFCRYIETKNNITWDEHCKTEICWHLMVGGYFLCIKSKVFIFM